MSESVASAQISTKAKLSNVWFIPVLAILIASWMLYSHYSSLGYLARVSFSSASGLEVNKTRVKLRNVEIGKVESIQLNDNFDGVWVDLRITKSAVDLLVEDTHFWVVRPRVGREGISGLDTLLSGAYIELSAGTSEKKRREFVGLDDPPATPSGTPGLHVTLESQGFTVFAVNDPILYRGIEVGKIDYVHFNSQERKVYYNAFIQAPYDKLVTTNTRFWEINGLEIDLSADGLRIETGSLETLIGGGLGFDVPKNMPSGERITKREDFVIYPNYGAINDVISQQSLEFILLFSDSIRGLRPGAPVEYRGVKVGSVLRTDIDYKQVVNILDKDSLIPVLISIEPARIGLDDTPLGLKQAEKDVLQWIQQGLSGGLVSGNLVTGSLYVELNYRSLDDAAPSTVELQRFADYVVIPSVENELDALFTQAGNLLAKLNQLPVESLMVEAQQTFKEASGALVSIRQSADQLEQILSEQQGQALLATINRTMNSIDNLVMDFSSGSPTRQLLDKDLKSLRVVLDELAPLLSELNRKPNSLIFSESKKPDTFATE